MKEFGAGKMKLGLAVCMVLIVCLLAFSGWTYTLIKDLQKQATELGTQNDQLQTQISDLESQVSSLETKVENLTEAISNITFTETEELVIENLQFISDGIDVTVRNTGTTALTVVEAKVNGATIDIADTPLEPGQVTTITIPYSWASGTTYEIKLITATGFLFVYTATAP